MKIKLSKSKFRVLLTEVLPYERPLFFSNKSFARLMNYYGVVVSGGQLVARKHSGHEGLKEFLHLISGNGKALVNYNYFISKDGHRDGRRLTVMHPMHQIQVAEFYDRFAQLMIHFCGKSDFSIRYPVKKAAVMKYTASVDRLISDTADPEKTPDSAKSFFVYEKYSNISNFYDGYSILNTEKEFLHLLKIDIERCFDSINPDLLPMLVYGGDRDKCRLIKNEFISEFVNLHKAVRVGLPIEDGSANGIIIGPEFSRIFAEIFLQHIEARIERKLEEKYNLKHSQHYKVARYVDDSFIAANSAVDISNILHEYNDVLMDFGLNIKKSKGKFYGEPPFMESLGLIKSRLKELVDRTFENRLETLKGFQKIQEGNYEDAPTFHSSKKFLQELRIIVAESKVWTQSANESPLSEDGELIEMPVISSSAYKDVSSYVLSQMHYKLLELLRQFNDLYRNYSEGEYKEYISEKGKTVKDAYEQQFKIFCEKLVESIFFLFSSDMRMSTSISVVQTIDIIQRFVRGRYVFSGNIKSEKFPSYVVSDIDETITKELTKVLRHKKFQSSSSGLMEILNLLELQHLMYRRNQIGERLVLEFLKKNNAFDNLHFFTAFQLIHLAYGKKRYSAIMEYVQPWLESQVSKFISTSGSDTESLLTVLELLNLSAKYGMFEDLQSVIAEKATLERLKKFFNNIGSLFMKWDGYKLSEEIDQRKGQSVY